MNKAIKLALGTLAGIFMLAIVFYAGIFVGHLVPAAADLPLLRDLQPYAAPPAEPEQLNATPDEVETLFKPNSLPLR